MVSYVHTYIVSMPVWSLKFGTSVKPILLHFTATTIVSYINSPSVVVPTLTFRVVHVQPFGKLAHSSGLASAAWLTLLNAENKFIVNKIAMVLDISPTQLCLSVSKQSEKSDILQFCYYMSHQKFSGIYRVDNQSRKITVHVSMNRNVNRNHHQLRKLN